jgi:LPS O-antigen subunit length determinant protein (WzzB/FepE family)
MDNQIPSDEIDLRDLIRAIWDGKFTIILSVVATMALAVGYIKLLPQTYKASMPIEQIDSFVESQYQPLSETSMLKVDGDVLMTLFADKFDSMLAEQLVESGYVKKNDNESDVEFYIRVGGEVGKFKLAAPTEKQPQAGQTSWQLSYTTVQPELSRTLLVALFEDINRTVKQQLSDEFYLRLRHHQIRVDNQIEDLSLAINALTQAYYSQIATRIANLKEQAAIARELNLEKHQLISNIDTVQDVFLLGNQDNPLYLNGYIALEHEISLLEQRQDPTVFLPKLDELKAQEYALLNDKTIQRADKLFKQTPLATNQFSAARINMAKLQVNAKISTVLVLALSMVLGGMLGLLILLVRNSLRKDAN